jgi:hypothetical protein
MSFVDINGKQDLKKILHYLARTHLMQKTSEEKPLPINFPLDIMFSREERRTANEVQSKSVKLGNLIEDLVRLLAENNSNIQVPKRFLCGPGVLEHEAEALWGKLTGTQRKKSAIFSRLPKDEVALRVNAIALEMRSLYDQSSSSFRTSHLRKKINAACEELSSVAPTLWNKKPNVYLVDFALRNHNGEIFFGELKASSGGDGGNAAKDMKSLLAPILALANYPGDIMPVAAIAFPSAPSSNFATVFPEQSIWSGEKLWQELLTPPLTFLDLKEAMEAVLPTYRHASEDALIVRRRSRQPRP